MMVITENRRYHQSLAGFFSDKPLWLDNLTRKSPNIRKLVEQPWQQTSAAMWDDMSNTLTDLTFIEAKCAAGMTYNLIADYKSGLNSFPEAQNERQKKQDQENRLKKYIDDLISYSKKEIQTLEAISSAVAAAAEDLINKKAGSNDKNNSL
jgi:hypothetical protein